MRLIDAYFMCCDFIGNKCKLIFVENIKCFQKGKQMVGNDFFHDFR